MTLLIAGGGIGGLATALAAASAGHHCVVLERAPAFGESGAGIQLGPNAFHALDRLGVGAQIRALAVHIDDLSLRDARDGGLLARLPIDATFHHRFGGPYAVLHRNELHDTLARACRSDPRIELRPGSNVLGYHHAVGGVRVELADGTIVAGRALIGADGLHSTVRAAMLDDGPPVLSGHITYRSVIPAERMPPAARHHRVVMWAGPGCHLVHYPLCGGSRYNLVVVRASHVTKPIAAEPVPANQVTGIFTDLCPAARSIVAAGQDWHSWTMCDRDPRPSWQDGPVVLLGDAAHPMLQNAAQGACMALEDAASLGLALAEGPGDEVELCLGRYVAARTDRTARVQRLSRFLGDRIWHPAEAAVIRERDRMLADTDLLAAAEWLYLWQAQAHPSATGGPD